MSRDRGSATSRGVRERPSRFEYATVRVEFESAGETCVGTLYRPDRPSNPPVVLMGPTLGGTRAVGLPRYAERFAAAGYAAFCFDPRGFGDSEGTPRQVVDPDRQVTDWQSALASVRCARGVDGARVVLWGHSLGGGNALRVAAGDRRVAAAVAVMPVTDGRRLGPGRSLGDRLRAVRAVVRDRVQSLVGRPRTVPLVGDPGEFALVTAPRVKSDFLGLVPDDAPWANETPARSFRRLRRYRPAAEAEAVSCPTLLVAGDRDDVVAGDDVEAVADDVREATLLRLPTGHFDVFAGDDFDRAFAHQRAFLDAYVGEGA